MLATLCLRLLDSCLARIGSRKQAPRSGRPAWRRSVLPADPARCVQYYGARPQQAVPRCRLARAPRKAPATTWPDSVDMGQRLDAR